MTKRPFTKDDLKAAKGCLRAYQTALENGFWKAMEVQAEAVCQHHLPRALAALEEAWERIAELEKVCGASPPAKELSYEEFMEHAIGEDWEGLCYG